MPDRNSLTDRKSGSWVELVKLLFILTAAMAVRHSFGVFFTSIENQFGLSRGATSTFFSVFMALAALFSIVGGWVLDRFGPKPVFISMGILIVLSLLLTGQSTSSWQLYFTYSLLLAAGSGGGFSLVLATVSRWFNRRRGLALGIALSGEGIGMLTVAPAATLLIAAFNWRTAFVVLGLFAGTIIIILASTLRKVPESNHVIEDTRVPPGAREIKINTRQEHSFSLKEAVKTGSFWFLGLVYLLFSLTFNLVLTHIVPHTTDIGITPGTAALIVSLIGGSTILGRLVIGWASDKTNRKKLAICCALFEAAAMLWLAWSNSLWMFYFFAVGFGFAFGGLSNLMATLKSDTFGTASIGTITGTLVVGFTLGAAIGPALGGFIFDSTNSYFISFLVGTGTVFMAAIFLALTKRETKASLSESGRIAEKGY